MMGLACRNMFRFETKPKKADRFESNFRIIASSKPGLGGPIPRPFDEQE